MPTDLHQLHPEVALLPRGCRDIAEVDAPGAGDPVRLDVPFPVVLGRATDFEPLDCAVVGAFVNWGYGFANGDSLVLAVRGLPAFPMEEHLHDSEVEVWGRPRTYRRTHPSHPLFFSRHGGCGIDLAEGGAPPIMDSATPVALRPMRDRYLPGLWCASASLDLALAVVAQMEGVHIVQDTYGFYPSAAPDRMARPTMPEPVGYTTRRKPRSYRADAVRRSRWGRFTSLYASLVSEHIPSAPSDNG